MPARRTTPAARVPGCRISRTARRGISARLFGSPMRPVETHRHKSVNKERRAKPARRSLAFTCPKPLLRSFHHPDLFKTKTPKLSLRVSRMPISNGASPSLSALGIRRARPRTDVINPNMPFSRHPGKPDISTLPGLGRFYFALTSFCARQRCAKTTPLCRWCNFT